MRSLHSRLIAAHVTYGPNSYISHCLLICRWFDEYSKYKGFSPSCVTGVYHDLHQPTS